MPAIFANPMLVLEDNRFEYGEERLVGIGLLYVVVAVVVYVEKTDDEIRVISVRKATKNV